jgi:hypothetical protein
MPAEAFTVEITVKGRVGRSTRDAVGSLDVAVVPRHDVVLVASGELRDLLDALACLQRRGIEVDRISHPGQLDPCSDGTGSE